MKKEGFDLENFELTGNDKVVVHRQARTLTRTDLNHAVHNLIAEYFGVGKEDMVVQSIKGIDDIRVPVGNCDYNLEIRRAMNRTGRIVGYLDLIIDGEIYRKIWIQVKVAFYKKVGVLNTGTREFQINNQSRKER